MCTGVCFTLMSAQKVNIGTTAMGRSLPYAQETYKAQYKSAFLHIFNTFEAITGIFYDVTGTDCWAQNGSTHGRAFATLKRRLLKIKTG